MNQMGRVRMARHWAFIDEIVILIAGLMGSNGVLKST